jgi:hypothetical protein
MFSKTKTLFLILTALTLFSCSKSRQEKKIAGTWDMVFLMANPTGQTIHWTFNDSGSLFTSCNNDSTQNDTATFLIDASFMDAYYLTISGLNTFRDGQYQILKLNKKYLILQRISGPDGASAGAFSRLEFVKL